MILIIFLHHVRKNRHFTHGAVMHTTHVQGIPKNSSQSALEQTLAAFMLRVLNDLSWLNPGETVLIKAAVNSPDPYPATTHPQAIKILASLIKDKGGIPVLGDQSGVEYVVQSSKGIVRGSSRDCFKGTGIDRIDIDLAAFEEDPWNSFVHFSHPRAANWPDGMYITRWIDKADHIVALPRISTHAQSGVTLGAKNWVGILRQDSRMFFHAQGPFNFYINYKAGEKELYSKPKSNLDFFEVIAEIQLAIASKLRGTVFLATELQSTMGPNKFLMEEFGIPLFRSHKFIPDTGLLIGSEDPVAADAVALAFLIDCYRQTPWLNKAWQKLLILANRRIQALDSYDVWTHPFIAHGTNLGLGSKIDHTDQLLIEDADDLQDRLLKLLK